MCGIAGILARSDGALPPSRETLARMAGSLHHRGPDEFGVYRQGPVGLAHARLSIVDLATGQQPLSNEDGTSWIVFNGEVFNYVELREELGKLGHRFRTHSDTEVIVHAYEEWGDDAFRRFNGQFAIALWNEKKKTLALARDPLGICPLFLMDHGGALYFASEVKAIFAADPTLPRAFDPIGIAQVFTFWTAVPPQSVFAGVEELRPGHVRTYSPNGVQERAYWQPRYPEGTRDAFAGTIDDAVAEVRSALARATSLRMLRADVPVGSYLSGGLDSSIVAALGLSAKGAGFATFSLRFEDAEYDETPHQRRMAEAIGSDHREIVVSRRDIAEVFPDVIRQAERPILRTAPAPLFLLSRLVRKAGIKVVLTGEGADEMFAGYDIFREAKVRRFWAKAPNSQCRPQLLDRLYPYLARSPVTQRTIARQFFGKNLAAARTPGFSHDIRWQAASALMRLLSSGVRESIQKRDVRAELLDALPPEFSRWTFLSQDQYLEVRTLLSGYLLSAQGDRMLMANSVEGRFPFLDPDVIELANALPPSYKLKVLDEKHVLKRSARGMIPDSIIARTKQPYRAPDALSFTSRDRPAYIDEMMSASAVADAGVFEPRAVGQLWDKCRGKQGESQFSNADNMAVVGVLSTQLLFDSLVRRPRAAELPTLGTVIEKGSEGT
ncbi:MAG: asparagine synthase (glutamine-hydrolyzing) [Polyangiaceae bacterium]